MIEPVIDALTTSMSPACSAKKAMISSAMFPNVALRMPPDLRPGERAQPLRREPDDPGESQDRHRRGDEHDGRVGMQAEVEDDRHQSSPRASPPAPTRRERRQLAAGWGALDPTRVHGGGRTRPMLPEPPGGAVERPPREAGRGRTSTRGTDHGPRRSRPGARPRTGPAVQRCTGRPPPPVPAGRPDDDHDLDRGRGPTVPAAIDSSPSAPRTTARGAW